MADDGFIVGTGSKDFGAVSDNRGVVVGDASGHTRVIGSQTNNYTYTERPETPPIPSCTIPFRRDPDFVDRGTLLDQVRAKCSAPAARVALVGLGGVGKSQLAIEHCYRTAEHSPDMWVFWVHASNAARLQQSYKDIADRVRLRGRNNPQADIFKLMYDWLCNKRNGRWLLVLDNADDADVFSQPSRSQKTQVGSGGDARQRHLSSYLPSSRHGSVLVTSRTSSAAFELVEENDIISIQPMHDASAQALLYKKLGKEVSKDGVRELATALEYMPLALAQAAAYIRQRAPRCSIQQYLEEFHRSDLKKGSLLNYEAGRLRRDREAKNSIVLTWQISFDHILSTRPSATDLLSLMSFFDRQGIPEALLRNENNSNLETSINCFEDDILTLRNYSFIAITTDANTFEMHRLVQLAIRKWLERHGQLEKWKEIFITNLCREFPTGHYENWKKCESLFPHAKAALSQQPESMHLLEKWALLLYRAAWYAWRRGRAEEAERLATDSMNVRTNLLGEENTDTLSSMAMVGLVRHSRGRWKEAEELQVQVMKTRVRVLGPEHPDTLNSMANLASTYRVQGRWKEAEELQVQVMKTRVRVLGPEHPDTLESMANLASTYWNQGRWKEAEKLQAQAMETRVRVLGPEHPDTLHSMANLASTYLEQGQWKKAEQLQVQAMETRVRVLGPEHPDTLDSMANLASTYRVQGRWKEAEELEVQAMETRVRVLGPEHPDTLRSMANLASTYWKLGRWKEAEELDVQAMETSMRVLGPEHPDTLHSMTNLASTYWEQERWKKAEKLEVQAVGTKVRVLGPEHPDTLNSMANLASTYWKLGRWKEAEELDMQAMETSVRVLGPEHPDTLHSMANLASTYRKQGRWKKAEELEVQVMKTSKRVLGPEHPDTLASMASLAFTWRSQGRKLDAIELIKECSGLQQQVLGSRHPNTVSSLATLEMWQSGEESNKITRRRHKSWRDVIRKLKMAEIS